MRQGTKILIGLVVVIGLAAGTLGWQKFKASPGKAVEKAPEPETPVLADSGAQTPAETPAPSSHEGTVASPPAPPVHENAERSFRARPVEPSPEGVTTAPAERTGLSELATPAPAEPEAAAAPPVPSAPETVTAPPAAPIAEPTASPAQVATPEAAPAAPSAPTAANTTEHVVQPGETYSSIAAKYLGSPKYAGLIAKANPGKDARRLYVGAKIKLPPAPAGTTTPAHGEKSSETSKAARPAAEAAAPIAPDRAYKVQAGESWQDLAGRFLHDRGRWTELYELNKERVPHNPQRLPNGTIIELPKGVSASSRPS